ncbi:hypothetical protein ACU635_08110 [[Actinomadura] parvosata]|uniref:hypothetical protein n=1 Tax=[Actinomadura] parvosata TaxID=1955412 RepID=UPI00406C6048
MALHAGCVAGADLVLAPAGPPLTGSPIGEVNAFYAERSGLIGLAGWLPWVVRIVVYGVRLARVPHTIAR